MGGDRKEAPPFQTWDKDEGGGRDVAQTANNRTLTCCVAQAYAAVVVSGKRLPGIEQHAGQPWLCMLHMQHLHESVC